MRRTARGRQESREPSTVLRDQLDLEIPDGAERAHLDLKATDIDGIRKQLASIHAEKLRPCVPEQLDRGPVHVLDLAVPRGEVDRVPGLLEEHAIVLARLGELLFEPAASFHVPRDRQDVPLLTDGMSRHGDLDGEGTPVAPPVSA
ncbi:MAG: hypothetical protein AMS20_02470 [Gemmatimonas sp. SG8_28]|nr:MAG: hypothetical protein AMS20_02470 [Gemmatimonas sp. SG8_28]